MPALQQMSATGMPSAPCFKMNDLLGVRKIRDIYRACPSPALGMDVGDSSSKRSSFAALDQINFMSGARSKSILSN